jgi:hypothetical protein
LIWASFYRAPLPSWSCTLNHEIYQSKEFIRRSPINTASTVYCLKNDDDILPRTLLNLASFTEKFEATDPRDKIFARVGLASDVNTAFIDYGLDIRQVLTSVVKIALQMCSTSTLLSTLDIIWFLDIPRRHACSRHRPRFPYKNMTSLVRSYQKLQHYIVAFEALFPAAGNARQRIESAFIS